jgi:hypothetical protein
MSQQFGTTLTYIPPEAITFAMTNLIGGEMRSSLCTEVTLAIAFHSFRSTLAVPIL